MSYIGWQTNIFPKMQYQYSGDRYENSTKTMKLKKYQNFIRVVIYMMNCEECNMIYVGETGCISENRFKEHAQGKGDRTLNSLYENHFLKTGHWKILS